MYYYTILAPEVGPIYARYSYHLSQYKTFQLLAASDPVYTSFITEDDS